MTQRGSRNQCQRPSTRDFWEKEKGGKRGAEICRNKANKQFHFKTWGKEDNFNFQESDSMLRLQGQERGRKGKLVIATDIFAVASSFFVVEVKKDNIDTL